MRYSKRCYTKRMQYYLKRKIIEFESENITRTKSKPKQAEYRNKSVL